MSFTTCSKISSVYASPILNLTVTTDRPAYDPGENVTIYGNLTHDGVPITDGLVGIQVDDHESQRVMIRTVTSGAPPQITPYVKLWSVIPCNISGYPQESFQRGDFAHFKLTVTNNDYEPRRVRLTITLNDPNDIPFFTLSLLIPNMQGRTTSSWIPPVPIPTDATIGNSTVYGNAYVDWPRIGGTPYCEEVSSTFLITGGGSFSSATSNNQPSATLQTDGNYNITLRLPVTAAGNYTVYTTSDYEGETASANMTFKVNLPGDANDDGFVNWEDLLILAMAYLTEEGDPHYDSRCDFNYDSQIDYQDLLVIALNYLKSV